MRARFPCVAATLLLLAILLASAAPGGAGPVLAAGPAQSDEPPAVCAPNLPPEVSAYIWPRRVVYLDSEPGAGFSAIVEAGGSRDPENLGLEFSFDVDGDGSYTPFFFNSAGAENVTMPGPFVTTVRVRDAGGAIATQDFHMVARQFEPAFVYQGWGTPALAVVAGRPAIAFVAGSGLVFAINSRHDGGGAWSASTALELDLSNTGFEYWQRAVSLAVVGGRPAIVLTFFGGNQKWRVMSITNNQADGSGKWTAEEAVSLAKNGVPLLGAIRTRPAIAYFQDGAVTLLAGGTPFSPDPVMFSKGFELLWSFDVGAAPPGTHTGVVGVGPAAALPALAFLDARTGFLTYAVNQQDDGLGRWDLVTVEPQSGDIGTPSLAMVNGRPAIAYRDGVKGHLKVATASAADGRGAWKVTVVDPTPKAGDWLQPSLAQIDGRPGVAYEHPSRGLVFAYDPGWESGRYWPSAVIDHRPVPFSQGMMAAPSLAQVAGRPGIVYLSVGGIRFAAAR